MRLIDSDAMVAKAKDDYNANKIGIGTYKSIVIAAGEAPTVEERPSGQWRFCHAPGGLNYWYCSACEKVHYLEHPRWAYYCPGCGAKMEREA